MLLNCIEMKLAYFGHVNIDRILTVNRIPSEGSQPVVATSEVFGGTAGNFAIVAAKLGLAFDLYSAVSTGTHGKFISYLESLGVDPKFLSVTDGYGPVCTIVSDGREQIALMDQGPMLSWTPSSSFRFGNEYDWVHFSTGPPDEYLKIAQKLAGKTRIAFDPGQEVHYRYDRKQVSDFLELSDLVLCNRSELSKMSSILGVPEDRILDSLPDTIVTSGERGVDFKISGKIGHMNSVPVTKVADTVGAGDAFRAGFYFGLAAGKEIMQSINIGQMVASTVIAQSPTGFDPSILFKRPEFSSP